MDFHRKKGARGGAFAKAAISAEEAEAQFQRALVWREAWRAERRGAASPTALAAPTPADRPSEEARRARFAAGMARLEFGRAYWDARKEREGANRK